MMHTPGPWIAVLANEECKYPGGVPIAVHRKDLPWTRQGLICDIRAQGDEEYSPEVTCANARLIAAAPDMLALLRDWAEASEPWAWPGRAGLVDDTRVLLEEAGP